MLISVAVSFYHTRNETAILFSFKNVRAVSFTDITDMKVSGIGLYD